jgi:hypothetical protein
LKSCCFEGDAIESSTDLIEKFSQFERHVISEGSFPDGLNDSCPVTRPGS